MRGAVWVRDSTGSRLQASPDMWRQFLAEVAVGAHDLER